MESPSVRYDIVLVVDVISLSIFWFLCLSLSIFLCQGLSRRAKMEPNANLPSKCSGQMEA